MRRTIALAAVVITLNGCASAAPHSPASTPTVRASHTTSAAPPNSRKPTPAPASTPPAPPTPSTTPSPANTGNGVILSPSGHYYRDGEYCPEADAGLSTIDAHGRTITCVLESGRYHWHY